MITVTKKVWLKKILILLLSLLVLVFWMYMTDIHPLLPEITDQSFRLQLTDPNEDDGIVLLDPEDFLESFEQLSPYIIPALLAIEDQRFYDHRGIDMIRIMGAAVANLQSGFGVEGGSTITQQLVKITWLDQSEKTMRRKIVEAITAIRLEQKYTKDDILLTYLNKVYFGPSGYGLQNASLFYFNKEPKALTLAESAIITGIIQNPTMHSPLNRPESMKNRAALVIRRMEEQGSITAEQADRAKESIAQDALITRRP